MDIFTFKQYIEETNHEDITKFKIMLGDDIKKIPERVPSSKHLINILNLNSREKMDLFSRVYLNYYRKRLIGRTLG